MVTNTGLILILCIIFGFAIYIIIGMIYCDMDTNRRFRNFFNSPEYIAYKQKHEKGEKKYRLANKQYTYDEKYKDFEYKKYDLFQMDDIDCNHHNMPTFYVGAFEGTAECSPNDANNGHYVVSIYDGLHNLINKIEICQTIFEYILYCGGYVRAYGNITEWSEDEVKYNTYFTCWDNHERILRVFRGVVYIECGSKSAETNPISIRKSLQLRNL